MHEHGFEYDADGQTICLPYDLRGIAVAGVDDVPRPISFSIDAAAGRKRFKAHAYSGGLLHLKEYPHPVIVDLAGLKASSQTLPVPKDHNLGNVIGTTDKVQIHAIDGVDAEGDLDTSVPDGEVVSAASRGGMAWEASIGATAHEMEEILAGESVDVNGRTFAGPVFVARSATLREISFVRRGADLGQTRVSIAASLGKGTVMFETWIKAQGWDDAAIAALTTEQRATLEASYNADLARRNGTAAATAQELIAEFRREQAAETKRVHSIRRHCHDFPEIEAQAIAEGWTEQKAELEVLRASRAVGPFTHSGGKPAEINASACFEAALCISAGLSEERVGKWFDPKIMNEAVGSHLRGASIGTLMHETIRAAGLHARPGVINDDTIRAAMRADRRIRSGSYQIRADGFSSLSMSGVLSNVANKAMVASYEAQAVVWPSFCAIRNHGDFKVHTRYRLDATGSLRKVGPDGELKHIGMSETSFTNQLDTYGAIVALTRQMQINDDLGAFLQLPTHLGFLAAVRPEEAFFVLLLGNATNFFHADNKNLVTGAGGVLTAANAIAAITAAELKFSNQVNANNKPIMMPPDRILCGTGNYVVARNAYDGRLKITGKDQTEVSNNEHAGKYEPYKSAFVNNTAVKDEDGGAISGQSSTAWWLFADPARRAAFGMAFLNGNRIPIIESDDAEFDTLGMQWRVYHDFGVGYEDPAAAVQVNGA